MGEGARPKCRFRPPFSSPPGFHDSDVPNGPRWMCSALNSYKQDFPKAGYLKGIQFECDGMHVMQEKRISCIMKIGFEGITKQKNCIGLGKESATLVWVRILSC